MKLIDQILNENSDSYITSVTKLEKVLEPFALMVAERMPVFQWNHCKLVCVKTAQQSSSLLITSLWLL